MIIFSIDQGDEYSGYTIFDPDNKNLMAFDKVTNADLRIILLDYILNFVLLKEEYKDTVFVIEEIKNFGMPMAQTTINSVFWGGRFCELIKIHCKNEVILVPRKTAVTGLCKVAKAKDGNVSRRLRDLFGEKGTKKNPGMLYGMKSDCWSALGLAVYVAEQKGYSFEEKQRVL